MSLSFKKTCNVAIASAAVGLAQHFAGKELHQGPYLVKQVGALNMKLQMQRASAQHKEVVAIAHPAVATVTVMPHSYEGKQLLIDRQKTDVDPSAENVVVLDPAGEFYMQTDIKGYGAGAASGAIYKFLNSDGKGPESRNYESQFPLPSDASENLKEAGKAHYVDYRVKNNFADLTNELSIVHAIGPNGSEWKLQGKSVEDAKWVAADYGHREDAKWVAHEKRFVLKLLQTYENAFHEFAKQQTSGKTEFWVVPVSSGLFCPDWLKGTDEKKQNFASMTAVLIRQAMKDANIENAAVKMHIFDRSEVQDFAKAFTDENPSFHVGDKMYCRDNLDSLVLEAESGVEVLVVAETQPDCPELTTEVASEHSLGGGVVTAAHDATAAGIKSADVTAAGIKSVQPGRKSSELVQRRRRPTFSCCARRPRHAE